MLNICLDISRLLSRLADGLLPTGVDRVGLAYVEHYRPRARAILSELGYSKVLSRADSERAFDLLLGPTPTRTTIRTLVMRGLLAPRRERFDDAVLLHTSHSGMERLRYHRAMRQRNIRSVFMVHDLIPLTHAEYCRPGIDSAHRQRIHTALRHADGLIANSQDTLDALETEANRAALPLPPPASWPGSHQALPPATTRRLRSMSRTS